LTFIDTNILIDIASANPAWANWSAIELTLAQSRGACIINAAVYAEFAVGFTSQAAFEAEIDIFKLEFAAIDKASAFLAAQAFQHYQRAGGTRTNVLADFLIGAHASVLNVPLLTRDVRRYRTYFPNLTLIFPNTL